MSNQEIKDLNNKAVIEAMTDEELFQVIEMINNELRFRQTDFLTIPHYNGLIKKGPEIPQQVEIIGPNHKVHYRRPIGHPDITEAERTIGYSVNYGP